jgi:hypothetical protein
VRLAAWILVSVGSIGLIVSLVLTKRKFEQLRRIREGRD